MGYKSGMVKLTPRILYGWASMKGPRPDNQDAISVRPMSSEQRVRGIVADGLGGQDYGEEAAWNAVRSGIVADGWPRVLEAAREGVRAGEGSTTLVAFEADAEAKRLDFGWMGDSGLCAIAGRDRVEYLTAPHGFAHLVTRCLNRANQDEFDTGSVPLVPGVVYVAYTDGFDLLLDDDLQGRAHNRSWVGSFFARAMTDRTVPAMTRTAVWACESAVQAGSKDNCTLVVFRVIG
jgi:serine/threonine protein phosphatase PrpC